MSGFIVPPGGFAGFANMTPASRAALGQGGRSTSPRRRRRKKSTAKKAKRAKKTKGGRKLKFGSPAWRKKYASKKRKKK